MKRLALAGLLCGAALAVPAGAHANTISVTTTLDEYADPGPNTGCSLREAIKAASDDVAYGGCVTGASGSKDQLLLVPGYTYNLTRAGSGEDQNETGDLDAIAGTQGVELIGDLDFLPTIDAAHLDRAIDVTGTGGFGMTGVRVINGLTPLANFNTDRGGAIRMTAAGAAGMTVYSSVFEHNEALGGGGAIEAASTGTHLIVGSTFDDNDSTANGTIRSDGSLDVRQTAVLNSHGGGIVAEGVGAGALSLKRSTVAGNFPGDLGRGGIHVAGGAVIENSTVSNNIGGFVGGIEAHGDLTVRFSTIAENGAPQTAGNSAGGIDLTDADQVTFDGALLWGNVLGGGGSPSNCNADIDVEGPSPSVEGADTCGLDPMAAPGSLINTDPLLAPLAANGGPTPTRGLYPGSPALDLATPPCSVPIDQRGTARPVAPPGCDIGAFEGTVPFPPPTAVSGAPVAPATSTPKKCKKGRKLKKGKCVKKKRKKKPRAALPLATRTVIGRSVQGRPIRATRLGDATAEHVALVVGVIHGDERTGLAVTRELRRVGPPPDTQLWIIDSLNPDGVRDHTRGNARGVDLNRNFPHRWGGGVPPSNGYYPGTKPGSEPETRAAMDLIKQIQPDVSIWYHQPWGAVLACDGEPALAARYANLAGMRTSCRGRGLRGTAIGWEKATIPGATAWVVEFPAGGISAGVARRHAMAARDVADGA